MAEHRMHVISADTDDSWGLRTRRGAGNGAEDAYICGRCGAMLARTVAGHAPRHQVYHCYVCGALNAVTELAMIVLPGAKG